MRKLVGVVLALLVGLTGLTGCPNRPRPVAEVEGEVTYDGQPVTSGIISFLPDDQTEGAGSGSAVTKGRYRIFPDARLLPGKYRVEIRWAKVVGKKKEVRYGESPDIVAEALPEKYHAESILKAEVEEGKNTVHFHLEK